MAKLSPCVVPSFDTMSLLPKTIIVTGSLYVYINMVKDCGQRICILCTISIQWIKYVTSINQYDCMYLFVIKYLFGMECMAASAPDWRPFAICNGPVASWISLFTTHPIHFPIILRITSSAPIGRMPWFLLRGISRHESKASTVYGSTISLNLLYRFTDS